MARGLHVDAEKSLNGHTPRDFEPNYIGITTSSQQGDWLFSPLFLGLLKTVLLSLGKEKSGAPDLNQLSHFDTGTRADNGHFMDDEGVWHSRFGLIRRADEARGVDRMARPRDFIYYCTEKV
jgi:hypothetical protein